MDHSVETEASPTSTLREPARAISKELDNIQTSDNNQHRFEDDTDHADSNCIPNHEFVHCKSVAQAFMTIYSGISTFSVALPPNPTIATDESHIGGRV